MEFDNKQDKDNKSKEQIKEKIYEFLRQEGEKIREDKTISIEDRLTQMDILLDTMKFLQNYEKNVEILNKNIRKEKEGR